MPRHDADTDKIDDAVLAMRLLDLHDEWDAMDRLYAKGFIANPIGRRKPIALTEEGRARAEKLFREMFARL